MANDKPAGSTLWAISSGISVGAGKGALGTGNLLMDLLDVENQTHYPCLIRTASAGAGLAFSATLSTYSPEFFRTSKPMLPTDFNGKRVSIATAELSIGIGGGISYMTIWGVDHDPYWLDIGGLEAGVAAGIGKAFGFMIVPNLAKKNNGAVIAPGGPANPEPNKSVSPPDPLQGGQSFAPPSNSQMSGGR